MKLQELVDRVKILKDDLLNSYDEEKIKYLKLAINSIYQDIRNLMESYNHSK
jgi:hypothetical protein